MSNDEHPIICGRCRRPVFSTSEVDGVEYFGCPDCGTRASKEEVFASAKAYATEHTQVEINKSLREVARKSKMMTFSGATTIRGNYDFIVEM